MSTSSSEKALDTGTNWNIEVSSFEDTVDLDAADELDGNVTIQSFDQEYDEDEDDEEDEDEGNESSDPIVLIEDYMRNSSATVQSDENATETVNIIPDNNNTTFDRPLNIGSESPPNLWQNVARKRSIAAFKLKYHTQIQIGSDDKSISSTSPILSNHTTTSSEDSYGLLNSTVNTTYSHTLLKKRSISADSYVYKSEDLEEIFGKIPGADLLKHCDLCDKPLYEVSSIIMNHNKKRAKKGGVNRSSSSADLSPYLEFVCGDCIGMYETFLNDFLQQYLEEQRAQQQKKMAIDEGQTQSAYTIVPFTEERSNVGGELNIQVIAKNIDTQKEYKDVSVLGSLTRNPCSDRLVKLFKDIQNKYDLTETMQSSDDGQLTLESATNSTNEVEKGFSPELISQLKKHTSSNLILKLIQSKLRWRWNYDGMVPTA
ncbi:uncharacterized protein KQ657_002891 [Scheffersomyces spartinae]|uniref:Uncharacterized protein n=1 Tax=Scheffersomyces spartinae TaxID=45513 RepID=A0A9P8AGT1_9ASCO|nr:uncharacterized protein KQ657_002891 [Scheffersomyces spartinae]KAG7191755.1 hypothetical protein KQ657_002891 [Scheffersomyces spartinae]